MMEEEKKIGIFDIFSDLDPEQKNDGNWMLECPSCGMQGGRTKGFILYKDTNNASCHSSGKWFRLLEAYAVKKGIIKCLEGRDKDQKEPVLTGDAYRTTLEYLKNDYPNSYDAICNLLHIKTMIELPGPGRLVSDFSNDLGKGLEDKNIIYFRPETYQIVEIGRVKHADKDEQTYNGIVEIHPNRFVSMIERYFRPYTVVMSKGGTTSNLYKSLSPINASIVMCADDFRDKMPAIHRIFNVPLPILKDKELLFPRRGYDKRFGSFLPPDCPMISQPAMTLEEAKQVLNDIYKEFCFKDEQSKTNAIAALLTPFLRGLFPKFTTRTPVMIYDANRERCGKDYCANLTGLLYEGVALEESALSTGDKGSNSNEELRKKLFTAMLMGRKRMHFANNKGHINSAIFEGVTTMDTFSDRLLGHNKSYSLPNEMDFSLSGNVGMTLTPDLMNRSIFIELFLEQENANGRVFSNPNLHGWMLDNRDYVLSALYSLVRNWFALGAPAGSIPFASFPEWSRICGGIMESAGLGNPCKREDTKVMITDSQTQDIKTLFEICYEKYPNTFITREQIVDLIKEHGDVFGYVNFEDRAGQINFWLHFRRYVGRVFSEIKLYDDGALRSARTKYRFEKRHNLYTPIYDITNITKTVSDIKQDLSGNDGNDFPQRMFTTTCENNNWVKPLPNITNLTTLPQTIPIILESKQTTNTTTPNPVFEGITIPEVEVITKVDKVVEENDRQVQFWEAPETQNIKSNYTKRDILEGVKREGGVSAEVLYAEFGVGSYKWIAELIKDGDIKRVGDFFYAIR
jgi:hypothetical protein